MKKAFTISLFCTLAFVLQGQPLFFIKYRFEPKNSSLEKQFAKPIKADSATLEKQISQVLIQCYSNSFLLASVAETTMFGDTMQVLVSLGKAYLLKQIKQGNVPTEWLGASGIRLINQKKQTFNASQINIGLNQLLSYAENNGYPFASVQLDSIEIDTLGITASINLVKNELIYFDSLDFGGTAKVKRSFLQNYSTIKPGMVYQEDLLTNLDARLSELSYVQVARPLGVYFYGNKAKPYLYINNRNASSFDGVIGFAPNSNLNNKLVVTGDLNLKLMNLMGTGKNLELAYRGYLNNSQDLQINFLWPYFLNTKLGIDYAFKLVKFDTTWLELANNIGLQYRFAGNNYVKLYYQFQNISLLTADTQYVINNQKLPNINDVRNDLLGLALRKSTLDYFFNPTKGILLEIEGGAGVKRILKNNAINDVELTGSNGTKYSIYDSTNLQSLQVKAMGNLSVFNKLSAHLVLHTQVKGAIIENENLFLNELFRIGGLKTLKGFDEQSIFASKYLIGNVELRYLFQKNSGFLLFWNGAWYKNEVLNPIVTDRPWGLGAGLNLETGAGIFSLYYALGKQKGNPFEFQRAKIHFGLVNFF